MSQRHEWTAKGVSKELENTAMQNLSFREFQSMLESLQAGHAYARIQRHFTEAQHAILDPQGVLSFVVMPIMLKNELWGFVGFDDCKTNVSGAKPISKICAPPPPGWAERSCASRWSDPSAARPRNCAAINGWL